MPYNQEQGVGKHEKKWVRALYALPILAFFFVAQRTFGRALEAIPSAPTGIPGRPLILEEGLLVPLCWTYIGWKPLDEFVAKYAAVFTGSIGGFDPAGRMQMIAFLADIVPIQVIILIEGVRRGNFMTVAHLLPTIISIFYQVFGIAYLGPIYFFLHYIQSPLENYDAADNRLTQIGAVKTIIPTVLLTFIMPGIAMFTVPGLTNRQWINGIIWQPFPIYAAILQRILGRLVEDTTAEDRITNPVADMPHLRCAYAFAGIVAISARIYVQIASPIPLREVFFQNLSNPSATVSIMEGATKALRYDQICSFGAGLVWIFLSFYDLKRAKKLSAGWLEIFGISAGTTLFFGPGAAMALMWAWREEVLARRNIVVVGKK